MAARIDSPGFSLSNDNPGMDFFCDFQPEYLPEKINTLYFNKACFSYLVALNKTLSFVPEPYF
jgi:hypothetical protein